MPMPPRRTIGVVCCLRESGRSIRPQRRPARRTIGTTPVVTKAELAKVTRAAMTGLLVIVTVAPWGELPAGDGLW